MNNITKEQLINNIKDWIHYDNELKEIQKKIKVLKQNKKSLTENIVAVMKSKEVDMFDLNDGKLIYTQNKTKTAINKKTLNTALTAYFKDDKNAIENLTNFILDNREIKIKDNIRHKIDKSA